MSSLIVDLVVDVSSIGNVVEEKVGSLVGWEVLNSVG